MNADEYNPNPGFVLETSTNPNARSVGSYMRFENLQPGLDGLILVKFWSPNWVGTLGNQPSRGGRLRVHL